MFRYASVAVHDGNRNSRILLSPTYRPYCASGHEEQEFSICDNCTIRISVAANGHGVGTPPTQRHTQSLAAMETLCRLRAINPRKARVVLGS